MTVIPLQTLEELDISADEFERLVDLGLELSIIRVMNSEDIEQALAQADQTALDLILIAWAAYVSEELLPHLDTSMVEAGAQTITRLALAVDNPLTLLTDQPFDVESYLQQAVNRLVGIGNELWFNARTLLAEGIALGESQPKLAQRIRDALGVTQPRARVIARTESHGARNFAAHMTMQRFESAYGVPPGVMRKEWQATGDTRTRHTHDVADGQVVGFSDPFIVGGFALAFPGDPTGPPQEVINCRCAPLAVFDPEDLNLNDNGTVVTLTAAADHTGAMIALALTEDDAHRLAIAEYEDVEELHLTLAYLGEGADWSSDQRSALISSLATFAASIPGPLEGDAFGANHWNPNGDDPCWVLGVGGEGLSDVHASVWEVLLNSDGPVPENHTPWIPHVCLAYAYGADLFDEIVARTGPITFDRLRVAFAGENTYIPLGGVLNAAAYPEEDAVPWSIETGNAECGEGQHAVVKDADGTVEGCHDTRDEALAQVAALYASEGEKAAIPASNRNTVPWSGVLVVEGTRTGDGREFAPNSLTWPAVGQTASLELPLGWMYERAHGGMSTDKVANVGRIDTITRVGSELHGTGVINLDSEWGRKAARQMGTRDDPGFLAGVSIDADDPEDPFQADVEYVFPEGCSLTEEEVTSEGDEQLAEPVQAACEVPEAVRYHTGRIRAATLVDIPAFVEGRIYLDASVPADVPEDDAEIVTASAYTITIPDLPPVEWFREPEDEPEIGAITVTEDGRFYGYLAPKQVAHRGIRNKRVTVPTGNVDYGIWMNRATIVDDGRGGFAKIATGPITMDCGHAPLGPKGSARREHYDNACSVVATACVGENSRGVWISGALIPGVNADQVARMMACQLSGDWGPHRERPGKRELAAALLVPVPGFPTAQRSFTIRGGELSRTITPVRFGTFAGVTEPVGLRAAIDQVAAQVGRDHETRMREFVLNLRETLKGE